MSKFIQSYNEQLSEHELDELADFLDDIPGSMNIEMMDGFLTALACSPELVMPSKFLHHVWGEECEFETAEQAQKYAGMILRHWNSITNQLKENDVFTPLMLDHEEGSIGNDWAAGFLSGVQLGGDDWEAYLDDEEESGVFVPIFMLAHEHDPDPELRSGPIDSEQREKVLTFLAVCVPRIYAHFEQQRESFAARSQQARTIKRPDRKIGRNEPCPCGSGKKFKKCCGTN